MTQYPEHEKLEKISDKSQACGEFLDWLSSEGISLCSWHERDEQYYQDPRTITDLLADYFDIDLDKIENEKRDMLGRLRKSA